MLLLCDRHEGKHFIPRTKNSWINKDTMVLTLLGFMAYMERRHWAMTPQTITIVCTVVTEVEGTQQDGSNLQSWTALVLVDTYIQTLLEISFWFQSDKKKISSSSYRHSVPLKRIIYKWRSPTFRHSLVLNHKYSFGCRDLCLYWWLRVRWVRRHWNINLRSLRHQPVW